jgi:catechol 2,3-dioxygenase-like lactoylglutathione lyase family enzyme
MKPRITLITLGVDDVKRSVRFYRDGLGLRTEGTAGTEPEDGSVVFFPLNGGLTLAIWPRASLAEDCGLPQSGRGPTEFALAHNVANEQEVDEVMAQAERAGARIVKKAQPTFWGGYAGYSLDPDDHLWEVAFNPHLIPQD